MCHIIAEYCAVKDLQFNARVPNVLSTPLSSEAAGFVLHEAATHIAQYSLSSSIHRLDGAKDSLAVSERENILGNSVSDADLLARMPLIACVRPSVSAGGVSLTFLQPGGSVRHIPITNGGAV